MTSPRRDWEELTDKDEITEIIEDINKQPLGASEEGIQTHSETLEQFIEFSDLAPMPIKAEPCFSRSQTEPGNQLWEVLPPQVQTLYPSTKDC